tara:strand:- start:184 stop:396 length:213 start_codon:yes stop_codon:yes gene_type:complete
MGMYNYVADKEEEFYNRCDEVASESETIQEFRERMKEHFGLISEDQNIDVDEVLHFVWEEKWSKYNMGGR